MNPLSLLIMGIIACAQPSSLTEDEVLSAALARIEAAIAIEESGGFDGQVAIAVDNEIIFARSAGFADAAHEIPVRDDTLFYVASLGKYVTAIAMLAAQEIGLVALSEPVAAYLDTDSAPLERTTLHDLLSHTSGIPSSYVAESETTRAGALAAMLPVIATAGNSGAFRYSNTGYDLLSLILEERTGLDFEEAVRQLTRIDARLSHFAFWAEIDTRDPNLRAQPLMPTPEALESRNYGMLGSGGVLFSARSLVEWQIALRRGDVLPGDSLDTLFAPRSPMSLGHAFYGGFLMQSETMGGVRNARGYEDRGENATLNDYYDCGMIVAVTTSSGPPESTGRPAYRQVLTDIIETALAPVCATRIN